MATKVPTITKLGGDDSVVKVAYPAMANADDGTPVPWVQWADRSVQVTGTFGAGGNVKIEGSNDGGTTYALLNDPQGNVLDITAAKVEAIGEVTELVRPRVSAGDGTTSVLVTFVMRRTKPMKA